MFKIPSKTTHLRWEIDGHKASGDLPGGVISKSGSRWDATHHRWAFNVRSCWLDYQARVRVWHQPGGRRRINSTCGAPRLQSVASGPKPGVPLVRLLGMKRVPAGFAERADASESGSRRSFSALYERHAPSAVRLAYLLTGEPDLAEDLVQDAFVKVLGRFEDLRRPDAFEAYLRRTIVNLSHSTFRRRRLERAYSARERHRVATAAATWEPEFDAQDELWHRLQRLAPRQRAALVLRYYLDLSERDTAEALGCSLRSAKSLVARGLAALRDQIAQQEGEQP